MNGMSVSCGGIMLGRWCRGNDREAERKEKERGKRKDKVPRYAGKGMHVRQLLTRRQTYVVCLS